VFVCNGPYSTLRSAMRKRGWIEKYFKSSAPACCAENEENENIVEDTKTIPEETVSNDSSFCSADDQDNIKTIALQQSSESVNEVFSSDSQYGIMSRIVRNFVPTLVWTLRRDDIDFRFLQRDQIVNHYASAWTFTTKTGLCVNLRNIVAFDSKDWRVFFPRCYRLCCEEEKMEFLEDYRLTMIQSILVSDTL